MDLSPGLRTARISRNLTDTVIAEPPVSNRYSSLSSPASLLRNTLGRLRNRRLVRTETAAVTDYLQRLPSALQRRYGVSATYTPQQVRRTINEGGFNQRFIEAAYLLHCGEQYLLDQGTVPQEVDELKDLVAAAQGSLPSSTTELVSTDVGSLDSTAIDVGLPQAGGIGDV